MCCNHQVASSGWGVTAHGWWVTALWMENYSTLDGSNKMPELLLEDVETFLGKIIVTRSINTQIYICRSLYFYVKPPFKQQNKVLRTMWMWYYYQKSCIEQGLAIQMFESREWDWDFRKPGLKVETQTETVSMPVSMSRLIQRLFVAMVSLSRLRL